MNKRTKQLQFSQATMKKIIERDEMCIFCKMYYHMDSKEPFDYQIHDIMHIVNKSQGGLGIEQNGVLGCRYHHSQFDNGNESLRKEMQQFIEIYMTTLYPGWNKENLIYKKENQ